MYPKSLFTVSNVLYFKRHIGMTISRHVFAIVCKWLHIYASFKLSSDPFSVFVTYLVMSNEHPAAKKNSEFKFTIHGYGNIIILVTTFILLELQTVYQCYLSLPLSVSFPLTLSHYGFTACRKRSFEQEEKP